MQSAERVLHDACVTKEVPTSCQLIGERDSAVKEHVVRRRSIYRLVNCGVCFIEMADHRQRGTILLLERGDVTGNTPGILSIDFSSPPTFRPRAPHY